MMATQDTFGSRLSEARRAAGLTQDQVGEAVGLSGAAISAWEVNRNQPSTSQLRLLCDRLNVNADYLLGREGA